MGLKEEMIKRIREITGNPNADLWTLEFNPQDANLTKDKINPLYVERIPIRTNENIEKESKRISKYFRKQYNSGTKP
jgi:hypothetical protein